MKLSKKVLAALSAAALLAMAGTFVACSDDEDEDGIIETDGKKASINYTNESSDSFARAFKTLNLDRTDATCKITIDRANSKGNAGVVGFMFNESKNKSTEDDVTAGNATEKGQTYYNFGIAGIGLTKVATGDARTYVSTFKYVNPDTLESGKNFLNLAGKDAEDGNITLQDKEKTWVTLDDFTADNDVFTVYVNMSVQADGSIVLNYYKDSDYTNNVLNENAVASETVTVQPVYSGLSKKDDGGIGFYANVYSASTLVGSWEFFDLAGNAIAIEE